MGGEQIVREIERATIYNLGIPLYVNRLMSDKRFFVHFETDLTNDFTLESALLGEIERSTESDSNSVSIRSNQASWRGICVPHGKLFGKPMTCSVVLAFDTALKPFHELNLLALTLELGGQFFLSR